MACLDGNLHRSDRGSLAWRLGQGRRQGTPTSKQAPPSGPQVLSLPSIPFYTVENYFKIYIR